MTVLHLQVIGNYTFTDLMFHQSSSGYNINFEFYTQVCLCSYSLALFQPTLSHTHTRTHTTILHLETGAQTSRQRPHRVNECVFAGRHFAARYTIKIDRPNSSGGNGCTFTMNGGTLCFSVTCCRVACH